MVWLVSAVVAGVVRDVTLATPSGLGLSDVADQSGCALVQAEAESDRLAEAVLMSRGSRLLVMKIGFQPDGGLIEEIDGFVRRSPDNAVALVVRAPETLLQRNFPDRAPIVGLLAPRERITGNTGFDALARRLKRGGHRLRSRAARIV